MPKFELIKHIIYTYEKEQHFIVEASSLEQAKLVADRPEKYHGKIKNVKEYTTCTPSRAVETWIDDECKQVE